jgi:hypothetical protein
VEGGRAFKQLHAQDPATAQTTFQSLVAAVDRDAPRSVDHGLALQLRFVARDLLSRTRHGQQSAPALAATEPLAALPALETLPLTRAFPTPAED